MSQFRLNQRAFDILHAEVEKCATEDQAGQVQRNMALKRLDKLRQQTGQSASQEELYEIVKDIYPNFSPQVLQAAAKANRPPSGLSRLKWIPVGAIGLAGAIWLLNLPYPMIRRPVAKTMPMVLLPSYLSMDYHYREAISQVEQADQLVNNATSAADFELGLQKVQAANEHLQHLPVWFLGYYPQRYCTLFGCSWQFTLDEFEGARKSVARMEAKIFQEQNALLGLREAEEALEAAKREYETATTLTEKQGAIAAWLSAIDRLEEIPTATLAGGQTRPKLQAAKRDFQQVAGSAEASLRTTTLIEAAKKFAMLAAIASQDPPHSEGKWKQVVSLWSEAIARLEKVGESDPGYLDAQTKLAEYRGNLATVKVRLAAQRDSVVALDRAKDAIASWQALATTTNPDNPNWGRLGADLQKIINQLEKVQPGTTVTQEAQELLTFAREKQKEIQAKAQ
ncbi:hypothetical protein [Phormidium sp. CCY1219]|uniref:hypothetical protein n=1 Tax=Phormidium sp. CCY1219 TaxID=2886104 RepID=UPI002D1EFE2A|nr:hypothetical protein [Phormidium sp. CCY1219]MEB3828960.1 hypothetical protein [Phormidium sp. CCY1219]